jgi:sigma-B regulation protein RsbU (phosphoserine phosphatase)
MDGLSYSATGFTLAPGESLILYTDGIPEAEDAGHDFYGRTRFEAALMAHCADEPAAVRAGVLNSLAGFTQGALPADDVTLLVLRFG